MRVTCSRCQTRYEVPDEKLSRGAVRIRCSRCGHLFVAKRRSAAAPEPPEAPEPAEAPPPETPVETPAPEAQFNDFDFEAPSEPPRAEPEPEIPELDEMPALGELDLADFEGLPDEAEPAPKTGPEPDEEPLEAVREEDLVPPTGAGVQVQGIAEDMPRLDLQRGPRRSETAARSPLVPKDRRRSPLFWVVLVAALGTAAFTGYNLYRHPEAFTFLSPQKIRDLWRRHQVETRLAVENLEGFYRDLPGGRRVFVIRGEVLNRSGIPQSLIRVKGNLFDARGRTVASREVFCGNVLGDRDLATLPAEAIDARLQNEVGNALQNMDIAPGGRVPFMVVFLPAPEGVTTYNVEVTEAREGASGG